ncbi:Uncharacterized protein APZ42_020857 [Daphnia magna]|uniref:Uncharacterized protein n=1 Tax=Daphnia magna TaxID=35525 RepID=A0A164XFU1_9CRUS|nr:Uncharacterized protein APZ42_020857 [Daphnia magna]
MPLLNVSRKRMEEKKRKSRLFYIFFNDYLKEKERERINFENGMQSKRNGQSNRWDGTTAREPESISQQHAIPGITRMFPY